MQNKFHQFYQRSEKKQKEDIKQNFFTVSDQKNIDKAMKDKSLFSHI